MQSSHAPAKLSAAFDDPTLIAHGGLEPLIRLAERSGSSQRRTLRLLPR
ncbi:hypothetical protein [Streptomyces sp. YIM 121038]|nr:hypothetical protein [Streptomyces sp. YIM 121038]